MKNIRNPAVAFVIFGMLVGLSVLVYEGFETNYSLEKQNTVIINGSEADVMGHLNNLTLVNSMNDLSVSIQKISLPESGLTDILGALAGVGIGVMKTITGIVVLPLQISSIIMEFYPIPGIIISGIVAIFTLIIGFILLSAYLRSEV